MPNQTATNNSNKTQKNGTACAFVRASSHCQSISCSVAWRYSTRRLRWRCWADCNAKMLSIMHKYILNIYRFQFSLLSFAACILHVVQQANRNGKRLFRLQYSMQLQKRRKKIYMEYCVQRAWMIENKAKIAAHRTTQRNAKNNYFDYLQTTIQQRHDINDNLCDGSFYFWHFMKPAAVNMHRT